MPRASSPKTERKPYSRSLGSTTPDPDPETKPVNATKTPKNKARDKTDADTPHPNATKRNTPWTNDEYAALFTHVVRHGAGTRTFETAVEGRNKNQSYFTWKQVIEPYIYDAIAKKTKGNPRKKTGKDTKDESDA